MNKRSFLAAAAAALTIFTTSSFASDPVLKAGMDAAYPPFGSQDRKTREYVGYDVDIIRAIAKHAGFKVVVRNLAFDGLIPALKAGNIDIVAAGMNKDDKERQKQVDFSDAYYESQLYVVVAEDNNDIKSIDDLTPDMKVAAQTGTTGAEKVKTLKKEGKIKEAVIVDGLDTAMMQLINGDVSAVINDKPVNEAYMKKQPDKIKMVGDALNAESYGFAVQKGNDELLKKINDGLKNIKEDGTFDKLVDEWFNK